MLAVAPQGQPAPLVNTPECMKPRRRVRRRGHRNRGGLCRSILGCSAFRPEDDQVPPREAQPDIVERIAEIREEQADLQAARPQAVIAALLKVAKACESVGSPAAIKEARLTLLEVERLRQNLDLNRETERGRVARGPISL